jgi:hypothetical protein
MGVMGGAFQSATYGWFGVSLAAFGKLIVAFVLGIKQATVLNVGVKKSSIEFEV